MRIHATLLIAMISLTGCVRMSCLSPSCLGEETYNNLMYPKPYGARWVKEGMTRESRREDSWACGADRTTIAADGPVFSDQDIEHEKKSFDKNDYGPRDRLVDRWATCMQSKGYIQLDKCDDRCLYP